MGAEPNQRALKEVIAERGAHKRQEEVVGPHLNQLKR
jgi:hypothetical protein